MMNKSKLNVITKNKARYFSFLLDRGFAISRASSLLGSFGNWYIEYESRDCFIILSVDQNDVFVTIYPVKADRNITIGLKSMIYYLTEGRISSENYAGMDTKSQLEKLAGLLEEYIDQITQCCGYAFMSVREAIRLSDSKYVHIQIANFNKRT